MKIDTTARLSALREKMGETATDLVAIAPGSHMDWLLGFHPHPDERPCLLLVGPEKEAFLMPALNAEGSREHTDIEFHTWSDAEGPEGALMLALKAAGARFGTYWFDVEAGMAKASSTIPAIRFGSLMPTRFPLRSEIRVIEK
jgi:Xaa-Pro aminopeptidase